MFSRIFAHKHIDEVYFCSKITSTLDTRNMFSFLFHNNRSIILSPRSMVTFTKPLRHIRSPLLFPQWCLNCHIFYTKTSQRRLICHDIIFHSLSCSFMTVNAEQTLLLHSFALSCVHCCFGAFDFSVGLLQKHMALLGMCLVVTSFSRAYKT